MKHCVSAIGIAATALSFLTACGSGSSNDPGTPPAPPPTPFTPKVTLNAPTIATVSIPFTVRWSADFSTGCTNDFNSDTGTSGSLQQTFTVPGSHSYKVTCTGEAGNQVEKEVTVEVGPPSAEGFWDGTIDTNGDSVGDRAMQGVVTREGDYWLIYQDGSGQPIGFYAGAAEMSDPEQDATGSFNSQVASMREYNFAGGNAAAQGALTSVYAHVAGVYSTASTLDGSFSPAVACPTCFFVSATGSRLYADSGLLSIVYNGSWDGNSNTGSWKGVGTIGLFGISGSFSQNFSMNEATGAGVLQTMTGCTDSVGGAVCGGLAGVYVGPIRNNSNAVDQYAASKPSHTGTSFVPVDGGNYVWSFYNEDPSKAVTDPDTGDTNKYWTKYDLNVAFILPPLLPGSTPGDFTSQYNPLYEQIPSLTTLTGSYTGSGGVNNSTAGGSTFVVANNGSVTGIVGACTYSATAAVHDGGGNVYDVRSIVFTGGACIYAGSGAFDGVARYDASTKQIVVMAVNSTRDKGFMLVGTKP